MQENNLIVKEPEELILMKGDFSKSALKLSAYLIANLKKDKLIYNINIKDYFAKFDKTIGDYNYLYKVTQELSKKQFKMQDRFNKKFVIFNFIASARYMNGILEIEFSQTLLRYLLEIKDKYLRYNIINIMSLSSKYVIRLYKILKDAFEKNARYGNKAELKLCISELREKLEIPASYQYSSGIKLRILEKAKKELEEHTDIIFNYEEIKTPRKVTHLKFIISANPKNLQTDNRIQEKYFTCRKNFVALLRKNYSGNKKFWGFKTIDNEFMWLGLDKDGLVYATNFNEIKDFNAVESAKLYDVWLKVAQNSFIYKELILNAVNLKELADGNLESWHELQSDILYLQKNNII